MAPVISPLRQVHLALKNKIKTELGRIEKIGVVEKQTEPSEPAWSLPKAQTPKTSSKREHYHLNTVEEVAAEIPSEK